MKRFGLPSWCVPVLAALAGPGWVRAEAILSPGDPILAIDLDSPNAVSSSPANEGPANVLDTLTTTKYLNTGQANSGFIVTPASGPSIVRSLVLTTANDQEPRDPASYALYGTNDPVTSPNHSLGNLENWTLISSGPLNLPSARQAVGPVVSFENTTSYTSYRLIFPTVKNMVVATSMQISGARLYASSDGSGPNLLAPGDLIRAVDVDVKMGGYLPANHPTFAIDRTATATTKYRNTGGVNSGFIVTPWVGPSVVTSFQITTANDAVTEDPAAWALYGTNAPIASTNNSAGDQESWTLIASGAVALPSERNMPGPEAAFPNATAYRSYRLFITALRDGAATGMQIGDIQFFGTIVNPVPTPLLAPGDPILAADLDSNPVSSSSYPTTPNNEGPANVFDGNTATKYLNFGEENSGFIVTPNFGISTVRSVVFTSANDFPVRDPITFALYGTNDAVVSANNSLGNLENWTLIATGATGLPELARFTPGPVVSFANQTAYQSYRLIFPMVRDPVAANSMQISEVAFYESSDGTGTNVLAAGGDVRAIDIDPQPTSNHPANEGPTLLIDGKSSTKYLNFGELNSGFIVTPSVGLTNVTAFRMITANDAIERDPTGWALYGTNDPIRDVNNSIASRENWTLIASGDVTLPLLRYASGPLVSFSNQQVFTSYLMVITSVYDSVLANSMQLAEIQFYGKVGSACPTPFADGDGDGDVDQIDYALFQACISNPGEGVTTPECACFDVGPKDNAVNSGDLAEFTKCFTGPLIPWSPAIAPDCVP
ncbi:MAG: hypothetical protein HRF43_02685 [Phycisphaerae bacterium]|jgi:hypothetical protein